MVVKDTRAASARSRRGGRRYVNARQMEPEQYRVVVKAGSNFGEELTEEVITTFPCNDLALVSYLYSKVSTTLMLPPSRLVLRFGDVPVPHQGRLNVMSFLRFQRQVELSCDVLEPKCCKVCQDYPDVDKDFNKGGVPFAYLYCPTQTHPRECYCGLVASEFGWRCIRSWQHLVRQARRQSLQKDTDSDVRKAPRQSLQKGTHSDSLAVPIGFTLALNNMQADEPRMRANDDTQSTVESDWVDVETVESDWVFV